MPPIAQKSYWGHFIQWTQPAQLTVSYQVESSTLRLTYPPLCGKSLRRLTIVFHSYPYSYSFLQLCYVSNIDARDIVINQDDSGVFIDLIVLKRCYHILSESSQTHIDTCDQYHQMGLANLSVHWNRFHWIGEYDSILHMAHTTSAVPLHDGTPCR